MPQKLDDITLKATDEQPEILQQDCQLPHQTTDIYTYFFKIGNQRCC
ncbi:hypothetical protein H6G74_23385 [Nostoc spongiaeforme FACHB-130]|uniref:Uncharacterized protein n=1 Tax=Nostoc spongiaeforme FACHB-130 TaxID=1357510 RepID=A0ABR8G1X5_9NOSO|nr:hypothetical protein [Nostoc spongiaeforme]MBD2597244.1 hypothetical protein [Nostoc spongiaeforme FACHB-130]